MRRIVLALLLMAVFAATAQAGNCVLGVNGGVLKGTGDFGDATKTGFGGGVFFDYWLNSMFSVGADFGFNSIKHHDDGEDAATIYPGTTGTIKDKFTLMNYGAHAKYAFPMGESPLHAYATAGLGMYNIKEKFEVTGLPTEEPSDTKFGGRGGLGAEYMMTSQIGIGAEGNFHFISTEGQSTQMISGVAMLTYHLPTGAAK